MANRSQQERKSSPGQLDRHEPAPGGGPRTWIASMLLAIAVYVVYAPALHAPFIFDDRSGIPENESIHKLWPLIGANGQPGPLNPGPNLPSSPRPLVNLSLAVNYYFGGADPFGYHVFSVLVHILTAILLWALVRRTLILPYFGQRFDTSAGWLALAAAMLWALHPLVTEAVIYATQRSEQMMAFFYLATIYCSLRYWTTLSLPFEQKPKTGFPQPTKNRQRTVWLVLTILACLAGMGSKEVMVSAPLMVLLYERTFIARSLKNALRKSWPLYIGLALTWSLLLIVSLRAPYGTAAGFGVGVPVQHYWLTQAKVFLMYLKLCFWPSPLLIHYELPYFKTFAESWMFVLPVCILGVVTLVLLWRNHAAGYLGAAVFAILAPTSLIPIRLEMAAERRMYLPLAAVVILIVIGGYWLAQTARPKSKSTRNSAQAWNLWTAASALLVILLGLIFCGASIKRLASYDSEMALWKEVLQHQPNNIVAHNNVGLILTNAGRLQEAIEELRATLAIKPNYTYGLNNLGKALLEANQLPEATETLESAVRLDPEFFQARNNLGIALVRAGRPQEAIEQLQQAQRLNPGNNEVRVNLGNAFLNAGRLKDSNHEYEAVLATDPNH